MALAIGIFVLALAVIVSERVHRAKIALAGAVAVIVTQTTDPEQGVEAIDGNTLGLLAGDRTAELMGIAWISAVASGIVDNIPFTATMIPVVEQLQAERMDDGYWWALALGACFGGNSLVAAAANVAPPPWPSAAAARSDSSSSSRSAFRQPSSPCCSPPPTSS